MTLSGPTPSPHVLPPQSTIKLTMDGRTVDFSFPDLGNMRTHVQNVLAGREYPLLRLQGYQATTIVDIGANVGAAAIFFHAAYPEARIYCFEPSPINFGFLHRNASFSHRIFAFPYGLLDRDADMKLFVGRTQWMQNSLLRSIETSDGFEMAKVRAAGREFDERGLSPVSILKLDTEGSELPILRDLGHRLSGVDFLYVEYHSEHDRRTIERMLEPNFILAAAHCAMAHRGTNVYVSNRIVQRFPALDLARIGPAE